MFSTERKQNLEFLVYQNIALKRMGVDIRRLKGKQLIRNYYRFLFLIGSVIYLECGLINFVAYHGVTNLNETGPSLSIFNQGFLILFKMMMFLLKGDQFMELIWDINQLAQQANPKEICKWLSQNKRAQRLSKMYHYVCWLTLTVSITCPFFLMGYHYHHNKSLFKKLPFGGRFPCDDCGLHIFIINYIFSVIYMYGLLNMLVTVDTLYGWFIHSISGHFRILRCKVQSAAIKLQNGDACNFPQEIGFIVNYHERTLAFVAKFNSIIGEILWAEIMLSSLQLCFIVYTLNNDPNVFNMPFHVMAFIVLTLQMIIYCFGGEKIKDESLMLNADLYTHFPWHAMTSKQKKLMLLPLMRAQSLSILKAYFFDVDRNLLVYVVKTAFSFNALLSTMDE